MLELKLEITKITVYVKTGMNLREALNQAKELVEKFGCEVEIPDFNGKSFIITYYTNVEAMISDYYKQHNKALGL